MNIGLFDADLMDGGTSHPNLMLMKISTYLKKLGHFVELIDDEFFNWDYDEIFVSKVFTKTKLPPWFERLKSKIIWGGTGFYATSTHDFKRFREYDFNMENFEDVPMMRWFNPACVKPDYDLYNQYISKQILFHNSKKSQFKNYTDFSIGFMTRGCVRHCPFCVNRLSNNVEIYSYISDFLDHKRPYIGLWDDNILAADNNIFDNVMNQLKLTDKPFQFRQGLDIRFIDEWRAKSLLDSKYYGDYIFAFDNINESVIIQKKLEFWRSMTDKSTKLYLFCGFRVSALDDQYFFDDVMNLFERIKILMKYGCLGYVMRHADYENHPMSNIYVQIARWVNQPQFYKKMSFYYFCYNEDQQRIKNGSKTVAKSLRTVHQFVYFCCEKFPQYEKRMYDFLNMSYEQICEY